MTPLLALLRLCSPALPVGGFSYSRGLEQAVERGYVADASSAQSWIAALLDRSIARVDLPAVLAAHRAFARGEVAEAERIGRLLVSLRESAEFMAEERNMGEALARLLVGLGNEEARHFVGHRACTFAVLFALAAQRSGVTEHDSATGYAFIACESQVSAAVRLVPLGQTDGQRALTSLSAQIPRAVCTARELPEQDWGGFLPGLAMASAHHENQYARLFRS